MSTPCSQSLRPNRLLVSGYEVPNVLVSRKWGVYSETPGTWMVFSYKSSFFPGMKLGAHDSGLHSGGDLAREDTTEGVETTLVRRGDHL